MKNAQMTEKRTTKNDREFPLHDRPGKNTYIFRNLKDSVSRFVFLYNILYNIEVYIYRDIYFLYNKEESSTFAVGCERTTKASKDIISNHSWR